LGIKVAAKLQSIRSESVEPQLRVHQSGSFVRFDHMFLWHDDIEFE
jgi:hypothetical protein